MKQLNRNVSENSLRLYLKKLKTRKTQHSLATLQQQSQHEDFQQTLFKRNCRLQNDSTTTPIHPSATATILPNELYYLYNNFTATSNGLIPNGNNLIETNASNNNTNNNNNNCGPITAAAAASMIYVNSENGMVFFLVST